jgi:uncharacterized protein (DUF342 family)
MPVIKGNLKLEIDELGLEARVTIVPDPDGAEVSPETVSKLLAERGIREGIVNEEIERAFRILARKRDPLTFSAAAGSPPVAAEPGRVVLEPSSLPAELAAVADRVLAAAPRPQVFPLSVAAVKDASLQAGTKSSVKGAQIDPTVSEIGYVKKGDLVGRVRPATLGKNGRSIYGRIVPFIRSTEGVSLLGSNLRVEQNNVLAGISGFLRRGVNWCDVVPYQHHEVTLYVDGTSCYLSFVPGKGSPPPSAKSVIEEAERLGMRREALLPEAAIDKMLREAAAANSSIEKKTIVPSQDAAVSVSVSPDKLRATLMLRKGKGSGKKLTLAEIGEAIRKSGIKGFNGEIVKKDILGFYNGPQMELADYTLLVGQPPEKGDDGKIEWMCAMLKKEDADRIVRSSGENPAGMEEISSLAEFPLESVESVGRVEEGTEILKVVQPGPGKPGVDVFRIGIPGIKGAEPKVKLFENLRRKKDVIVSAVEGIVERGTRDGVLLVRARPHRDAALEVVISEDRMKGFLSSMPAQGTGRKLGPDEVKALIEQAGIVQGLNSEALLDVLDSVSKNLAVANKLVAQGKPAKGTEERKVVFHTRLASGRRVRLMDDGTADFKNQDTITQVSRGELLATLPPPGQGVEDGWDVTGKVISAVSREETPVLAGRNVRTEEQPDGGAKYFADADGELSFERNTLEVKELHTVGGDVDLTTGNVKFKGKVHVKGSVLSGFTVVAGDDAVIDEVVQASFVSSDGAIAVGQGIKGEGRAVLRARKLIRASFAEQANLLSMGDVRLKSGCLRCQIKCNGKLVLESEKGNLMGGRARAKLGASIQNLGSPGGARTELSFGQDYIVKDQIEKEEKELEILKHRILELDMKMKRLERSGAHQRHELEETRAKKLGGLKELEQRSLRLLGLRDRFEEHFPSEVVVRGTMYPGAVVESHGRLFKVKAEKARISLSFDATFGRIIEKPAK